MDTDGHNYDRLNDSQEKVLLDKFFTIPHLEVVRFSIHKPTFHARKHEDHPEFLVTSICALAALYIDHQTSVEDFEGNSPTQLSEHLAVRARHLARLTSDRPSGM